MKAEAAAADVAFCTSFVNFTAEFGSNQPTDETGVGPQTSPAFVRRWKEAVASLDALAPTEIAPVMRRINAVVQQAENRESSPASSAADENTLSDWLVVHCGFNQYGKPRNPNPNSNPVPGTARAATGSATQSGAK